MGLPAAVPQLSENPAAVPVNGIRNLGQRRNAVVSKELDIVGIRRRMNGRRLSDDETASTGSPRLVVCDEVRARESIAQHARHVARGKDSIAYSHIADLNRLEEVREKRRHQAVISV